MGARPTSSTLPAVFCVDEQDGITAALFRDAALREQAVHSRTLSWPCALRSLPELGSLLASGRNDWSEAQLVRRGEVLCHVRVDRAGHVCVRLASAAGALLDRVEGELRTLLPEPPHTDEASSALLRFWHYSPHGASWSARRIAVPRWADIAANYPQETREHLEPLMVDRRPGAAGQLLLWHGLPGTGKTFALRALLWQWRDWCDPHFILDPETFFGGQPDYMVQVILGQDEFDEPSPVPPELPEFAASDPDAPGEGHDDRVKQTRWRLLILEDTGELLAADAKERAGQGMSRLLNVVDGLVGQGLRLLVLVTGNEPLQRLHPALSRPGRCGSLVEFGAFDRQGAARWLTERDHSGEATGGGTLAELYARLDGRARSNHDRHIGFA